MPYFLYHPQNSTAKKIVEATGADGFVYQARPHMEAILRDHFKLAELDLYPTFYCYIGSMAGTIDKHLQLNPDDQLHAQVLKVCANKSPWSFVKVHNGSDRYVVGYCNSDPSTPFLMTTAQQAQAGIIRTSHVPT